MRALHGGGVPTGYLAAPLTTKSTSWPPQAEQRNRAAQ
jgi:hypothetical protein